MSEDLDASPPCNIIQAWLDQQTPLTSEQESTIQHHISVCMPCYTLMRNRYRAYRYGLDAAATEQEILAIENGIKDHRLLMIESSILLSFIQSGKNLPTDIHSAIEQRPTIESVSRMIDYLEQYLDHVAATLPQYDWLEQPVGVTDEEVGIGPLIQRLRILLERARSIR